MREHGGRTYIRLNTWNHHRTKLIWYTSKRHFVIPIANARPLADALCKVAAGRLDEKPDWLLAREQEDAARSQGRAQDAEPGDDPN